MWKDIKKYLKKPTNALIIFENAWSNLITFNLDLWAVYYLVNINVTNYIYIAGFEGFFIFPGTLLMEFLISLCPLKKRLVTSTFCALLVGTGIYFVLVPEGPGSLGHYFFIFYALNFFAGGPMSRTFGETAETVKGNAVMRMVIINIALLLKELLCALFFFFLGITMKMSLSSFVYAVCIINLVLLGVHLVRRLLESSEKK